MKKQYVIAVAVLTLSGVGIGLASTSLAGAEASTASTTAKSTTHPKVFSRVREDARLNQALTDNAITAAQRTAVKAEIQKLRIERKSSINKSSTAAEKQTERTKLKVELQSWANTNNFPVAKVFPKLAS